MQLIRLTYRLIRFGVHFIVGAVLCVTVLRGDPKQAMTPLRCRIVRRWLHGCCRIAGLRIRTFGQASPESLCFVANHISWADIIVIGGLHPVRFLSKSEIARWPVIGYLASRAGTLYIRRGQGARAAFEDISASLRQNDRITLFPEGTTSKDRTIHRFHPRLFAAPLEAGAKVQAIAISYPADRDRNRDLNNDVPFTEGQSFVANAAGLLKRRRTDVEVRYLEVLHETDREQLAKRARELIVKATEESYGC